MSLHIIEHIECPDICRQNCDPESIILTVGNVGINNCLILIDEGKAETAEVDLNCRKGPMLGFGEVAQRCRAEITIRILEIDGRVIEHSFIQREK